MALKDQPADEPTSNDSSTHPQNFVETYTSALPHNSAVISVSTGKQQPQKVTLLVVMSWRCIRSIHETSAIIFTNYQKENPLYHVTSDTQTSMHTLGNKHMPYCVFAWLTLETFHSGINFQQKCVKKEPVVFLFSCTTPIPTTSLALLLLIPSLHANSSDVDVSWLSAKCSNYSTAVGVEQ